MDEGVRLPDEQVNCLLVSPGLAEYCQVAIQFMVTWSPSLMIDDSACTLLRLTNVRSHPEEAAKIVKRLIYK